MKSPLTMRQVDAAIERLAEEHNAIATALVGLEEHTCRQMLDATTLVGVTEDCWSRSRHTISSAWAEFRAHRAVLETVRAERAQRSPSPAVALRELTELLTDPTVLLPAEGGAPPTLTPSVRAGRRVSVHELGASIKTRCSEVSDVLAAVDRVWTALPPRIQRCREALQAVEAFAAQLGLAADDEVARAVPETLSALHSLAVRVQTDPMSLWSHGAVDDAAADHIEREADRLGSELKAIGELRERAEDRLARAIDRLAVVTDVLQHAEEERRAAAERLSGCLLPPVPQVTDCLHQAAESADALRRGGCWRELSHALPELERELEVEHRNAESLLVQVRRPLRHRAELRGMLGAYRAKARRLGRAEDVELEQQYRHAREVLRHRPCDLPRAAALVAAYQHAVNAAIPAGSTGQDPPITEPTPRDAA
jgi:hypothetical protein